jgi:hypothetical protein
VYSLLFLFLLIFRSFIHLELILVWSDRHGSSFSFLHVDIQYSL